MNKKLLVNLATLSFFVVGAVLIGIGIYLLAPSGEQSKLCYNVDNPDSVQPKLNCENVINQLGRPRVN